MEAGGPAVVSQWDECFQAAVQVAQRAGQVIRKAFTEEKHVSTKTSAADLVTETDCLVEHLIISELRKQFPSHRFISEEATAAGAKCELTSSPTWVIDPIDGTCNFVHGFPNVAVSIGFAVHQEVHSGPPACSLPRASAVRKKANWSSAWFTTAWRSGCTWPVGAAAPSATPSGCAPRGRQVGSGEEALWAWGLPDLTSGIPGRRHGGGGVSSEGPPVCSGTWVHGAPEPGSACPSVWPMGQGLHGVLSALHSHLSPLKREPGCQGDLISMGTGERADVLPHRTKQNFPPR
ncbi:inositol monophosphatase 2 isoform X1 [Heterocephalus glaber]|uniref:inositol-phosphate phosphatase n=1 Tax=Heterocephalus glaber TaxID=10181 RepID=A0AAX6TEY8_HETGA|nr:inositol monophosphatase 2 isoform X1 [Heterocephalus glaber]